MKDTYLHKARSCCRFVGVVALGFLFLLSTSCARLDGARASVEPSGMPEDRVAKGTWGGDHIQLVVSDDGGQVEYDCAHGTIDEPLRLDRSGRFNAVGKHVRERGGPEREGEERPSRPARYTGSTDGKTMNLTVTLTDSDEQVGTFTLSLGKQGRLFKCL